MALSADILENIVPISDFGRGKASGTFERVTDSAPVIVVKHNTPIAVITTPAEYRYFVELEEDMFLLTEALGRMQCNGEKPSSSLDQVMTELGITEEDLASGQDVEFE